MTKNGPDDVMTHIGGVCGWATFDRIKLLGFTTGASHWPPLRPL